MTATVTKYAGTFGGRTAEVSRVRREIARYLGECPVTDDVVFIAGELATNCVLHSHSRGGFFRVRCELSAGSVRIAVEDMGGPWRQRRHDERPHGLNIVEALAGPDAWGIEAVGDGGRIVWSRLTW